MDKAKTKVGIPILPMNMTIESNILDKSERLGVMPRDKPTVPKADTTSNKVSRILKSSVSKREKVKRKIRMQEEKKIRILFLITSSDTVLLKRLMVFFPFKVARILRIKTKKVVVFIPPPVEPGEAPMNI